MSLQLLYSICYFVICMGNGITLAFFPLYSSGLSFSPIQIAALSAAANIATLLAAPGSTALAHHHFSPRRIHYFGSLLGCIVYFPLMFLSSFPAVFITWLIFLLLNAGANIIVDTRAFRNAAEGKIRFERARIWGSIGFIASLAFTGGLIDLFGTRCIIIVGFAFACVTHGLHYLIRDELPATSGTRSIETEPSLGPSRTSRALLWILVCVAFSWASHAAYYVYFSIYLRTLGWSGFGISAAWNVGVIAEIILFQYFYRITARIPLTTIIRASALLSVSRWAILASTANPTILFVTQTLHAFSFGAIYLSSIKLVQLVSPPEFRDRAQGLLSGFGSGGGSVCGRIIFGLLASNIAFEGDYYLLFWPAALLATLGFAASCKFSQPDADRPPELR